jgi:hypothetical protein
VATPTTFSGSSSKDLNAAAGAGIGMAIGAIVLGGALVVALYIRMKRYRAVTACDHNRLDDESRERVVYQSDPSESPPTYELDTGSGTGAPTATTPVFELHHSPLEIDGTERGKISVGMPASPS